MTPIKDASDARKLVKKAQPRLRKTEAKQRKKEQETKAASEKEQEKKAEEELNIILRDIEKEAKKGGGIYKRSYSELGEKKIAEKVSLLLLKGGFKVNMYNIIRFPRRSAVGVPRREIK